MDDAIRQVAAYRDRLSAANARIERLESELIRLQRESESIEKKISVAQERAAWYRSKLLKFVTTKWIQQEKRKDGI